MVRIEKATEAYRIMAELGYRPGLSSDGLGNITTPRSEWDIDHEAEAYCKMFTEEEDTHRYAAGVTDYRSSIAAMLILEAFRLCNAGLLEGATTLVPRLLQRAAEEYERSVATRAATQEPVNTRVAGSSPTSVAMLS